MGGRNNIMQKNKEKILEKKRNTNLFSFTPAAIVARGVSLIHQRQQRAHYHKTVN